MYVPVKNVCFTSFMTTAVKAASVRLSRANATSPNCHAIKMLLPALDDSSVENDTPKGAVDCRFVNQFPDGQNLRGNFKITLFMWLWCNGDETAASTEVNEQRHKHEVLVTPQLERLQF
jgi:hypothetical protein